jgi:hypothetical protein
MLLLFWLEDEQPIHVGGSGNRTRHFVVVISVVATATDASVQSTSIALHYVVVVSRRTYRIRRICFTLFLFCSQDE